VNLLRCVDRTSTLGRSVVRVVRSLAQMNDGKPIDQEPKSRAGRRTVAYPREISDELRWHLERFAQPGDDGLVFVGPHSSSRAALIYQHAPRDRDEAIAAALGGLPGGRKAAGRQTSIGLATGTPTF
jgi:hypothetical protein